MFQRSNNCCEMFLTQLVRLRVVFLTMVEGNSGEKPQTNYGDHRMNELNHNNIVKQML